MLRLDSGPWASYSAIPPGASRSMGPGRLVSGPRGQEMPAKFSSAEKAPLFPNVWVASSELWSPELAAGFRKTELPGACGGGRGVGAAVSGFPI